MVDNDLVEQMKAEMRLARLKEQSGAANSQNQVKLPLKGSGVDLSSKLTTEQSSVVKTEPKSTDVPVQSINHEPLAVPELEVKTKLMQECECCNNLIATEPIVYKTMKMCQDCFDKEKSLEAKVKDEEPARIAAYEEINKMNKILQDAQKSTEPI